MIDEIIRHRGIIRYSNRYLNTEIGAFLIFGSDRYFPSHRIYDALYYSKAKSGSFDIPVPAYVRPCKRVKEILLFLFLYTPSCINDIELKVIHIARSIFSRYLKSDAAFIRILYAIVYKVYEHLPYPDFIRSHSRRNMSVKNSLKGQSLGLCPFTDHSGNIGQHPRYGKFAFGYLKLSRFYL